MISSRKWNGFLDLILNQIESHFPFAEKIEIVSFSEPDADDPAETLVVQVRQETMDNQAFQQRADEVMAWVRQKSPAVYGSFTIIKS